MPFKNKVAKAKYQKGYWHLWYRKRADRIKAKTKKQKARIKQYIRDYKIMVGGCSRCSEKEPCCIDFHHPNGVKEINVSDIYKHGWAIARIKAELDQCDPVCANCHRKINAGVLV